MRTCCKLLFGIIINTIMLILSVYLLINGGRLSLDLLSNPNLDIATELVRFFWGLVGTIYFSWFLLKKL